MVQPGRKDEESTQIAPVFVRDDVIGIVRSGIKELKIAHELVPVDGNAGGNRPIAPLAIDSHRLEKAVDVFLGEIATIAHAGNLFPGFRGHHLGAREIDDIVFQHIVPQGVKDLGGDHLGSGGHLQVAGRVKTQQIHLLLGIDHQDPRPVAELFHGQNAPRLIL